MSGESGKDEVYITDFPDGGLKQRVSTNGGVQPRWSGNGKELFYIALDSKLMSVPVEGDSELEFGEVVPLFEASIWSRTDRRWRD